MKTWVLVSGISFVALALLSQPTITKESTPAFGPPPAEEVLLVMALGDRRVAADLGWLMIVQRIGSSAYLADHAPDLESWAETVTRLDPVFESPYFIAAAFLTALPERADRLDRLLAAGESALPHSSMIPMARGLVFYFGRYEPDIAARHFRTAVSRGGGPPYLAAFAARLERLASSCRAMGQDFGAMQVYLGGARSDQAKSVAFECSKRAIERAAAAWRLRGGSNPTLDELAANGDLKDVVWFQGECWHLDGGVATLEPCQ